MYVVKIEDKDSPIHGKGVFALEDIPKDKIVWEFTAGHDKKITVQEFEKLPRADKEEFRHSAYLSPSSNMWVCPPINDPARYTNHNQDHNLSAVFNAQVSDEPYFIANRDIKRGEELTNNYLEFDKISQQFKETWLKNT